jgi:hypothetical protein
MTAAKSRKVRRIERAWVRCFFISRPYDYLRKRQVPLRANLKQSAISHELFGNIINSYYVLIIIINNKSYRSTKQVPGNQLVSGRPTNHWQFKTGFSTSTIKAIHQNRTR